MRVRMAEELSRVNSDSNSFKLAPRRIAFSNWMRSLNIRGG